MELLLYVTSRSKRPRLGVRQSIQLTHVDEEAKKRFSERLERLRQILTPGSKDNLPVISKLMEIAENTVGIILKVSLPLSLLQQTLQPS